MNATNVLPDNNGRVLVLATVLALSMVALAAAFSGGAAAGQHDVDVSFNNTEGDVGDQVAVSFDIDPANAPNAEVGSYEVEINYDETVLSFVEMNGVGLRDPFASEPSPGTITANAGQVMGEPVPPEGLTAANVVFKVDQGVPDGEVATISLNDANSQFNDPTDPVTFESQDGSVTVGATDSDYQLSNLVPQDATVTQGGDPITVSADVTNEGKEAGDQTVTLEVADQSGNVVFSDPQSGIQVGPGETQTVSFQGVPAGTLDLGDYTHSISTNDDSISGSLTVQEEPENASVVFEDQTSTGISVNVREAIPGDNGVQLSVWTVNADGNPGEVIGTSDFSSDFSDIRVGLAESEFTGTQTLIAAVHNETFEVGDEDPRNTILDFDSADVRFLDPAEDLDGSDNDASTVDNFFTGQVFVLTEADTNVSFTRGEEYDLRNVESAGGGNFEVGSLATELTAVEIDADAAGVDEPVTGVIIRSQIIGEGTYVVEDDNNDLSSGDLIDTRDDQGDDQGLGTAYSGYGAEIVDQDFEIGAVEDEIFVGDDVEITENGIDGAFLSNRAGYSINVIALNENGDPVRVDNDGARYRPAGLIETFSDVSEFEESEVIENVNLAPGNYTLVFDVPDTTAQAQAPLTVEAPIVADIEFTETVYTENRGDVAELTISTDGLSSDQELIVTIGAESEVNYETALVVTPDVDPTTREGQVTITMNTFAAGAQERLDEGRFGGGNVTVIEEGPTSTVFGVGGNEIRGSGEVSTLEDVEKLSDADIPRILDPSSYQLSVGLPDRNEELDSNDASIYEGTDRVPLEEEDVATLQLEESDPVDVRTWTAPAGQDDFQTFPPVPGLQSIAGGISEGFLTEQNQIAIENRGRTAPGTSPTTDKLVFEAQLEGVYGAIEYFETEVDPDNYVTEVSDFVRAGTVADEGVFKELIARDIIGLDIRQENPSTNQGPKRLGNIVGFGDVDETDGSQVPSINTTAAEKEALADSVDDGAVNIIPWAPGDQLFVSIDISQATLVAEEVQGSLEETEMQIGDQFTTTFDHGFALQEAFTQEEIDQRARAGQTQTDTLDVVDRRVSFDSGLLDITDDVQTVTGSTTLATGTELTVQARSTNESAPFLLRDTVEVDENGSFEASFDLTALDQEPSVGQQVTLSVPNQGLFRDGAVPAEFFQPSEAAFEVSELAPLAVSVEQGTAINVSATVTNVGGQEGSQDVELTIDGNAVESQELTLGVDESQEVVFENVSTGTLAEGDYEHAISSEDDTASGALTITVEPQTEATFTVSDLTPQSATVEDGAVIDVSATVENIGDLEATQEVTLEIGEVSLVQNLTLSGGENETVTFAGVDTSAVGPGEYTHTLSTEDASASGSLTVQEPAAPAAFEILSLTPQSATVEDGAVIDVSAVVQNTGDLEATQEVTLEIGEVPLVQELTLNGSETETVTFADINVSAVGPGEYTHTFSTEDASTSGSLTVQEPPAPAAFEIVSVSPEEATATQGDTVTVSATVQNTGDQEATQTVNLDIDGITDSSDLTLGGGEAGSVSFDVDTSGVDAGDYTHTVSTEDDEFSGSLTIENVTMDNNGSEDGSGDGSGAGFGVAIAALALLGAALLAARRKAE